VINDFLELNSLADIVQLVRQNAGVTVIPVLKNFGWSQDPELCVLPLPGLSMARKVGFLEHGPRSHITGVIRQRLEALLRSPRQAKAGAGARR
jgi:DNA-binding transcriptional LysR family regulator